MILLRLANSSIFPLIYDISYYTVLDGIYLSLYAFLSHSHLWQCEGHPDCGKRRVVFSCQENYIRGVSDISGKHKSHALIGQLLGSSLRSFRSLHSLLLYLGHSCFLLLIVLGGSFSLGTYLGHARDWRRDAMWPLFFLQSSGWGSQMFTLQNYCFHA